MTTVQRVQQAHSPQQAMLAIAAALDRIEAKLDPQPPVPADPWGEWTQPTPNPGYIEPAVDGSETVIRTMQTADAVEDTERALAMASGEDRRALEAKLRLLKDEGVAIVRQEAGVRVQSVSDGNDLTIDIPSASPDRRESRRCMAKKLRFYEFLTTPALTEGEFIDAYAKGGPMYLYLGDRDAIMAMPPSWYSMFIEDIEQDSPLQAQEVARDLLMDRGAGTPDAVDRIYSDAA